MPENQCPECAAENEAHVTYCLECGSRIATGGYSVESSSPTPNPHPDTPTEATVELLEKIASDSGYPSDVTTAGHRVRINLGNERTQSVHLMFNGRDDEGHEIISFVSVCGPYDPKYAEALLRLNSRIPCGAFAIRTIEGDDYLVVTANQIASTADPAEIRQALFEVAVRADVLESRISGGKDAF